MLFICEAPGQSPLAPPRRAPPRRCFRTPSPSQDRAGTPWCSGRPARNAQLRGGRGCPAVWPEPGSSGNSRCSPGAHPPCSLLRTGAGAGGHRDPTLAPGDGPAPVASGRGPLMQLRPPPLPRGKAGSTGDTTGTSRKSEGSSSRRALHATALPAPGPGCRPRPRPRAAVGGLGCPSPPPPTRGKKEAVSQPAQTKPTGTGVTATLVVQTGRMRLFWALIFKTEKNTRKLYSIFPVKVIILRRAKEK